MAGLSTTGHQYIYAPSGATDSISPSGEDSMYINTEEAIAEFLRSQITDPRTSRAYSDKTDTLSGTGSETQFKLSTASARYIESITVDAVLLDRFKDYNYDLGYGTADLKCTVTFTVAPSLNTGNIVIVYKYGGTEWIYPDYPDFAQLGETSYPRISVIKIDKPASLLGSSSEYMKRSGIYQLDVWVSSEQFHTVLSNGVSYKLADANLLKYLSECMIGDDTSGQGVFQTEFRSYFQHTLSSFKIISYQAILPTEYGNLLRSSITIGFTGYQ